MLAMFANNMHVRIAYQVNTVSEQQSFQCFRRDIYSVSGQKDMLHASDYFSPLITYNENRFLIIFIILYEVMTLYLSLYRHIRRMIWEQEVEEKGGKGKK